MKSWSEQIQEHQAMVDTLASMESDVQKASQVINNALQEGNKLLLCGNGGSAADAQHIAAEIIGRFETERLALPAIALTTDTSILTAVGNDYGYDHVFSRQVEGLGQAGDVLLAYSTSGNSQNVINAVEVAKQKGMVVISLTGKGGGQLAKLADIDLCVKATSTARIQEAHGIIGHALCAWVDQAYL